MGLLDKYRSFSSAPSGVPQGWEVLPWENGPGAQNNFAAEPINQIGQWGGNDWGKLTGFQGQAYLRDRDSEGSNPAFLQYLQAQGFTPSFRKVSDDMLEYQVFDRAGKPVGTPHQVRVDPSGDLTAMLGVASLPFAVGGLQNLGAFGQAAGAAGAVDPVAAAAAGGFGDGLGVAAGNSLLPAGVGGGTAAGFAGGVGGSIGGLGGAEALGGAAGGFGPGIGGIGGAAAGGGGTLAQIASSLGMSPGSLLQGGLGLVNSLAGMWAANKAAGAQVDASREANRLARDIFTQTRQDNMPALEARNAGLTGYRGLLADPSSVTQTPGYDFRMGEGRKLLEGSAAARGGLYSGNALKALTRYGQDYATNEYDRALGRYGTLAGIGQPGANTIAGAGQNYATTAGNNILGAGNARGASYVSGYNALSGGINNFLQRQMEEETMRRVFGGG